MEIKTLKPLLGMVVNICNPGMWETEAGGS
jgi:hypothetical protein